MDNDSNNPESNLVTRRLKWLHPRHLILLLIILIAAFLRFWSLDRLPPGLNHDEAYNGLDALALLEGSKFPIYHEGWEIYADQVHGSSPIYERQFPVFFEGNFGREPLYVYLTAISIFLFGSTSSALRVASAIAGVIGVLTVYLAASILSFHLQSGAEDRQNTTGEIFHRLTPLIAAFFTAILYPAISFSRLGLRVMIFVPLSAFAVYAFWHGIRKSEQILMGSKEVSNSLPSSAFGAFAPRWFIAAGILVGIGFYSYAAARFLPIVFGGYVIYWFISERESLRNQWGNLLAMALSMLVTSIPLLIFFGRHPYYLIYRSRYIANRGEGTYPGKPWITWSFNVVRVLRGLFLQGDTNIIHNLPGRPFLDPIQSILLVFGIANSVVERFKRQDVFLLLWFLVMLLPSVLSGDAPHFGRLIGIVPPVVIIMARGTTWIGQLIINTVSGYRFFRPHLVVAFLMILLIASGLLATNDYFRKLPEKEELTVAFFEDDWLLGKYAQELPEDSIVYLVPTQEKMATIYFAVGDDEERLRSFYSPAETLLPLGRPGLESYYLVRSRLENTINRLMNEYGFTHLGQTEDGSWAFSGLKIEENAEDGSDFLATWGGAIALREMRATEQGDHLSVILTWQALVEMERSYTAYVHLLAEDGTLISQLDRIPNGYPTNDWQSDEVILDQYDLEIPGGLGQGKYFIQTGFYYLPSGERLGKPVVVSSFEIQ